MIGPPPVLPGQVLPASPLPPDDDAWWDAVQQDVAPEDAEEARDDEDAFPLAPIIPLPIAARHPGASPDPRLEIVPPAGMDWTAGQAEAIPRIMQTIGTHGVFNLSGFAGTGKSVLLAAIVQALHRAGIPYIVLCPTGRAAARLRSLGIDASTIHSWRYVPEQGPDGELHGFRLREDVDVPPRFVLLLDEASMIAPDVYGDLVDTVHPEVPGRAIIAVGDPFQLPPVLELDEEARYGRSFCVLDQRYAEAYYRQATGYTLTDVVRQASGSPVIGLATSLRSGQAPPMPDGDRLLILRQGRRYLEARIGDAGPDAVFLTWNNNDRRSLNRVAREARGYRATLVPGERLVVLANHRDTGLCNGDLIDLVSTAPWSPRGAAGQEPAAWEITFRDAAGRVSSYFALLDERQKKGDDGPSAFARARKLQERHPEVGLPLVVDYGYCLTVHKAQGSEWESVYVYAPDAMIRYAEADHSVRWLYTAVTRARQRVVFSGGGHLAYCLGG